MKPTLFIGSSTERLPVARALKEVLTDCADVTVWKEAPEFVPGDSLLAGLIKIGQLYDFALLVFGQDDCTMMSDMPCANVRDNVLFELGLFIGHMGRDRALWLSPRGSKAPTVPDDLKGIVYVDYDETDLKDDKGLLNSLAEARPKIYQRIKNLGLRNDVVPMRRALCLASSAYEKSQFKQDLDQIHHFFSEGEVTAKQGVTVADFYEYFSPGRKWDMVHLGLYVDSENRNLLLDTDSGSGRQSLSIQNVGRMIKDCGAQLVVIITCDSLTFSEQLARFTAVIAGHQKIDPFSAIQWAKVFYKALSVEMTLFEAFDKAQDETDPGLVLLARKDIRFRRISRHSKPLVSPVMLESIL
jgi:Predicted nucleotide-binding protein containing TIR -like domain